jgi:hypothetical protein
MFAYSVMHYLEAQYYGIQPNVNIWYEDGCPLGCSAV